MWLRYSVIRTAKKKDISVVAFPQRIWGKILPYLLITLKTWPLKTWPMKWYMIELKNESLDIWTFYLWNMNLSICLLSMKLKYFESKQLKIQPLTFEVCNVFSFYLYISFGSGDLWPLNLRVFEAFVCLKWIKTHIWDKYVYFSIESSHFL